MSDDAFISFRYADNLVRGLGLVFNPGERVEGYSNFLWTLWAALGLRLGADVERWTMATGGACYAAALGLLIWNSWVARGAASGPARWIPIAALLGALHPDWSIFATGGLETSLFTFEVTLLYVVLAGGVAGARRATAAGLIVALASMTRPDGLIFAGVAVAYLLWSAWRRPRAILAFSAAFLLVWGPYTAWRVSYFGDFFPNTYYAKSAAIAWYSQGAVYVALYFARYWQLLLGPALVLIAWPRTARDQGPEGEAFLGRWRRSALLAAMLAAVYIGFVLRVGGDFMFARFLIPVTPLLLALFELGTTRLAARRAGASWALAGLAAAGIVATPYPLPSDPFGSVRGIVFEPNYYAPGETRRVRDTGLALRPFFDGLPVRVAFFGGEARLVYYARPRIAIECVTGLTDRRIARQPLARRTRIGHEKLASVDYVLGERRAHFAFFRNAAKALRLDREIPEVEVEMAGVRGRVLTWDPALMDSLRHRGAQVPDFPAELDSLLWAPGIGYGPLAWMARDKLRRFYFDQTPDPRREALWTQRLGELE
ncbi:MAG TPA: hypothetical protein VF363_10470 [Candidatus Eisenbacteria bacterium]